MTKGEIFRYHMEFDEERVYNWIIKLYGEGEEYLFYIEGRAERESIEIVKSWAGANFVRYRMSSYIECEQTAGIFECLRKNYTLSPISLFRIKE